MIIKCITNKCSDFVGDDRLYKLLEEQYDCFKIKDSSLYGKLPITVGRLYLVYALQKEEGYLKYFIIDDDVNGLREIYPVRYFPQFFSIVDGRCSEFWNVKELMEENVKNMPEKCVISFKEWAEDHRLYSEIVEGGTKEWKLFIQNKQKMDYEFVGDAAYVNYKQQQCGNCKTEWDCPNDELGDLIQCPNCKTIQWFNLVYPKTVEEAVKILISRFDKNTLIKMKITQKEGLIVYHLGHGERIRNEFRLYKGNKKLLEDCGTNDPEEASFIIIKSLWETLQNTML